MKKLIENNKKITAAVLALILGVAAVIGIVAAVRATTSSTVMVVRASELNYGEYLDWQNSVAGMITTDAEQDVYLSDTEVIEEVLVTEGQSVHKGDVLMRYDTTSTKLSLEKEKINYEKLLLEVQVAEENLRKLNAKSPISDGGFGVIDDFGEFDPVEQMEKATVYEKVLKADAKPVNDDPEDETLGTEGFPYVFLCKGDSVTITKDFIKKWQKKAKKQNVKHLYIALETRDKGMNLLKSWISDVMRMDPRYDIDVDLTTGKTSYAAMNDPAEMAKLLRKILKEVPEDERGHWLAVLIDKLMVTTEKEEKRTERGELLASMINELSKEDQEELSAAAARMDEETLAIVFRSLSEALTSETLEKVDEEATAAFLTVLLTNMTEQQVQAIDAEHIASLIGKLSAEQVNAIGTDVLGEIVLKLNEEQLRVFMQKLLAARGEELTDVLQEYLDSHPKQDPDDPGTGGDGQGEGSGQGQQGGSAGQETGGSGQGQQGGNGDAGTSGSGGTQQGGTGQETGGNAGTENGSEGQDSGNGQGQQSGSGPEQETGGNEGQSTGGNEESGAQNPDAGSQTNGADGNNQEAGEQTPSTAPSPADDKKTGAGTLLSDDMEYTSEELEEAKREARDELRDLKLSIRESQIKITKGENALDQGVVTANMDGVIKTAHDPQSPPTDGSAFLVLSGSEGLFVRSGIKESKLGTIKEGDKVLVTSWQTGGQYEAEIKNISPYPDTTGMFDDNSETYYPFTASILDNGSEIENGEWVEVSYMTSTQSDSGSAAAMTIAKAFVREEGNRKYVYKRGDNNKLTKQYIETGNLSDSGYEVLSGLSDTDWIAFPYGKNVKEGARTREGSVSELYE